MTDLFRRTKATAWLTIRRIRSTIAFTAAVIISMGALIGVWVGIPLYAESASARLLAVEIDDAENDGVPFGYLFSYNRLSGGNQTWGDFNPLNELIEGDDAPFGPTVRTQQRVFTSLNFDIAAPDGESVLTDTSFSSLSSFDATATLAQGRLAKPAATVNSPIEAVVDAAFAETNGLATGQEITVINRRAELDAPNRTLQVLITGVWVEPAEDPFLGQAPDPETRFLRNGTLTGNLIVPETTLSGVIDPLTDASLTNAQWLVLLDSGSVTTDGVNELLANTERINRQVDDRLRGARLLVSPETSLRDFRQDVTDLNRGLALFSLPTLALVLAVTGLLISMRWSRRLPEVAVLRRRGVAARQIIAETALEAIIIAAFGAALGLVGARLVATFIGRTETFLRLGDGVDLNLVMNTRSWRALAIATVIAAAMALAPALGVLRDRILNVSRSDDAEASMPWWQRTRLDLAVVIAIALFSWFLLRNNVLQGELLDDPIVILLPAVSAFAVGLAVLRVLPIVMTFVSRLLERTDKTAALLVARRIGRMPRAMTAPVLLLVLTGSLAIYTGSLARTLDLQLLDVAHHTVGATSAARSNVDQQLGQRFELVDGDPALLFQGGPSIDPDAFDRIWGVSAASRVATLPARLAPSGGGDSTPVNFVGIDPSSFDDVAFWRADYASESLEQLMANLSATPDGVLLASPAMQSAGLQIADRVTVSVREFDRVIAVEMVVVGSFDQFPVWVPGEGLPPAVANLSDFEARAGASVARELIFDASPDSTDEAQTRADLSRLGIGSAPTLDTSTLIERAQLRPQRQGVFGLLTVSFALSAALTVVGFMFYAVFGFTDQLTELGVLRALGLRLRTLMGIVALDLLLVAAVGVGTGTLTGLAMARWYLPRLVASPSGSAPVLLEEIDWSAAIGIPLALSGVLVLATVALLLVLRRIRLFEAIKVGAR